MTYKPDESLMARVYKDLLAEHGCCCGLCANAARFYDQIKCAETWKCLRTGAVLNGEKALYNKQSCFVYKVY